MARKIQYLCNMEIMLKKFCKKYKLPEKSLFELLSHMEEISFSKGELIIEKGERNSNFYLIKKGIWRAYYLADGTENSLWFATPGDAAFSSWGYVDDKPSQVNIESVNDSTAYCISKTKLEALHTLSKWQTSAERFLNVKFCQWTLRHWLMGHHPPPKSVI